MKLKDKESEEKKKKTNERKSTLRGKIKLEISSLPKEDTFSSSVFPYPMDKVSIRVGENKQKQQEKS